MEQVAYLNVGGTFYYLCSILDGCSRFIAHWEIHEAMKEADVELIIEHAPRPLRRPEGPHWPAARGWSLSRPGAGRE